MVDNLSYNEEPVTREMWLYRRILRKIWTEHVHNEKAVNENIKTLISGHLFLATYFWP